MSVANPFTNPDAWDSLTIGGVTFTGRHEWSGDVLKRKIDRRHAAGRDGAHLRDKGYDLAELELSLRCSEARHWDELGALVALLFPRGSDVSRRAAHACAHPALAIAGITEVYATTMGTPRQVEPTVWEVQVKLVEYRADSQRNTSHRPRAVPDIGSTPTAFTGTEAAPPAPPTPPATPGPEP